MAASIITRLNEKYNRFVTVHVQYPIRYDVDPIKTVSAGRLLASQSGFPANYEPPSVSFKTYRSLCNWGFKKMADHVLQNKKRSFVTPNYVWNGVMEFGKKRPKKLKHPSYDFALKRLESLLDVENKIPIMNMEDSVKHIPRSTSPGFPWITLCPGVKKGEILDQHFGEIANYWKRVGAGLPVVPLPDCAAFARSHISSPDVNKVRPVWAYPLTAICQESRFAIPLINLLKEQKIMRNSAYGMEMMKGGMTWLNSQAMKAQMISPGCKFVMLDFKAFDSSLPAWLLRDVLKVFEKKFDFSKIQCEDGTIMPADPVQERRKFSRIVNYFINTPIRNSDGRRFQKDCGIPSGSMITNIIGTGCNVVTTTCLCDACIEYMPIFDLYFGDDSFLCLPSKAIADIDALADTALAWFGLTYNRKKSYATTLLRNIHFLGYHNNSGSPVKDPVDLIASMLYPQYLKDDWSYCISRALGCILAAAGSSTDVFLCGQAVWHYASRFPEVLDRGIRLIEENPRSKRFIEMMGCGDLPLSHDFFFDICLGIPAWSCSKLSKNISLVSGIS